MVSEGCLQGYNGVCVGVSRVQWCVKGVCNGVLGVQQAVGVHRQWPVTLPSKLEEQWSATERNCHHQNPLFVITSDTTITYILIVTSR